MDEQPVVSLRGVVLPGLSGTVSFDLAAGDCVVLLDADAERRTALLQIVAGAVPPSVGTVESAETAAVWHHDGLPEHEPVAHSLRSVLSALGAELTPQELLEGVGLAHRAEHEPWAMSVGERRRIAIAAVFASTAALLILDEPERGLDVSGLRWLRERIRAAQHAGRVVLLATHDAALAEACGDFVIESLDTLTG